MRVLSVAVAVAALTACAAPPAAPGPVAAPTAPAESPAPPGDLADLSVPVPDPDDPDPVARSGAAGRLVRCEGPVADGGFGRDDFGPPALRAATPTEALTAFLDADWFPAIPTDGYRPGHATPTRALFTYDVAGAAKVAVVTVLADGDGTAGPGWGVETVASCDAAEYDPSADADSGFTVWEDAGGRRVPTATLSQLQGDEHCDWGTVTFLQVGDARTGGQYVRDPDGRFPPGLLRATYDGDVALPPDAVDTGYRQGERRLWLTGDGIAAYAMTPSGVERWPATTEPVACR